jgi:hypothetical protein
MTYWWNEIGDRISLFNLADICPKAWFFYPKSWDRKALGRSYLLALLFFSIGFRDF